MFLYAKAEERRGNPITEKEILEAKRKTQVNSLFTIQFDRADGYGTNVKIQAQVRVKAKYPYLCMLSNNVAVPWWKLAMYYRRPGNRVLEI